MLCPAETGEGNVKAAVGVLLLELAENEDREASCTCSRSSRRLTLMSNAFAFERERFPMTNGQVYEAHRRTVALSLKDF